MATNLQLNDRILVYEDATSNNDPKKVVLDYSTDIIKVLTSYARYDITLTGPVLRNISMPVSPCNLLYMLVDNSVYVRLNGSAVDNVLVYPSVVGTKNGVFFKRGNLTQLDLSIPASTTSNITLFVGI